MSKDDTMMILKETWPEWLTELQKEKDKIEFAAELKALEEGALPPAHETHPPIF